MAYGGLCSNYQSLKSEMLNTTKLYFFNMMVRLLPPSRFYKLKARALRWCGAKVGRNVQMFTPKILGNFDLELGDNVWIGHDALIFGAAGSKITVETNAKIASRAIVVTGSHEYSIQYDNIAGPGKAEDIRICSGAMVGTATIILPGKTVGKKAHVAAGSIVTHDVPDMVRVAGVPARIIKDFKGDK